MKIGIEISGIPGITPAEGQARYAFFLVKALLALYPEHDFTLFYNSLRQPINRKELARLLATDRFTFVHTRIPFTDHRHWVACLKYRFWAWLAARRHLDLFHGPSFQGLPQGKVPGIISIPDIAPDILNLVPDPTAWRTRTIRSINRSIAVIAISEHTRQDLVKRWHIAPEKVHTVLLGYNPPPAYDWRQRSAAGRPYFLYVGSFRPNKNIPALLRAFALVGRDHHDLHLVMAGGAGGEHSLITDLAGQLKINNRIKMPGFVPDHELDNLYRNAIALVHPSLYEGFGLTILEAMGRGCPVISSNATSLPEVAGDAGIMVDPQDHATMARAMTHVLDNRKLREELREMGLRRAGELTWEKTATATMTVYEQALAPARRQPRQR